MKSAQKVTRSIKSCEFGPVARRERSVHRLGGEMSGTRPVRPRTPKGRAREVARRLAEAYPDAVCELDHANAFELLTATILSAQTTDVRVNMVTPQLFATYPTPEDLARAEPAAVEEIVRPTGFYQNRTKSIIGMATALVERFGGEVPTKLEDLVTIPGVGRKTGNVVRSVAFDLPGLPVAPT
jgi:endonuclease-3